MKLNKPGVFQIVGEKIELLAIVVGEAPHLRVTSAIVMNEAFTTGKFTILKEESYEIQDIYLHPDAYVSYEYEASENCKLPVERRSMKGAKMPDIDDNLYKEFINRYLLDISVPGRGTMSTKIYIMDRTSWTATQAQLVLCKIAKAVKQNDQ